jgi:hypothetical protein
VAEHWAEIADVSRFHQPHSVYEEFIPAIARVKAGAPPASSSNPEIAAP